MLIQTLLNKVLPLKSFVYDKVIYSESGDQKKIVVEIRPRANGQILCSCCSKPAPKYDRYAQARLFEFINIWGCLVFFSYRIRRVRCRQSGKVVVEQVPWAKKGSTLTYVYQYFLAHWAKKLSWQEAAQSFRSSWYHVCESVQTVVSYGLENRVLSGIKAIGVDEWHRGKGKGSKNYVTLIYQIDKDCRRLLYVGEARCAKTLLKGFRSLGKEICEGIEFVCSDMWKPYLKVIAKKLPQAVNILDRFHIVANLNKAINEVRSGEARQLRTEGYEDILTNSKYCFLKNPENLSSKQESKLKDLLHYDLKSVRAYQLKESFQFLWTYKSVYWARWYLNKWCARAMRSRLEPMKKFAKSMRRHEELILNYFRARKAFSSGVVEGLNRKINLTTRKAYGYKRFETLRTALFHTMGNLPEPKTTHNFF